MNGLWSASSTLLAMAATLGVGLPLMAQPTPGGASKCASNSGCGPTPCQVVPGGPINICNCCPNQGLWTCCDNVACRDCILNGDR